MRQPLENGSLNNMHSQFQLRGCALGQCQNCIAHCARHYANARCHQLESQALDEYIHASKSFNMMTVDDTMKMDTGVKVYIAKRPVHSDPVHASRNFQECLNACVLTARTSDGGLMGLVRVQNGSRPEHVLSCNGGSWTLLPVLSFVLNHCLQFIAFVGFALDTSHLPMKYESVADRLAHPCCGG